MIHYDLTCDAGHAFASWFASSAAYGRQVKRGLIACPVCGSTAVEKAIMAPALSRRDRRAKAIDASEKEAPAEKPGPERSPQATPVAMLSGQERELRAKLKELREHLVKNADYVGQKFPDEARRMHYGEIEHRSIYGEASPQEAEELHEEGIEVQPLPFLPDERN